MARGRRLKGLRVGETSGVDAPAHRSPGWAVLKSEDPEELEAAINDLIDDRIDAAVEQLDKQAEDAVAETTPPDGGTPETPQPAPATPPAEPTAPAAPGETPDQPTAADVAARDTTIADLERQLAEAKGEDAEALALTKAMETLPEPVRKAWAEDRARVIKAEKIAEEERDARLSREYLEKAAGYSGLPTKAESLATVLRKVDEHLDATTAAELTRLLKAASDTVNHTGLWTERGGVGAPDGSAQAELDATVADLRKSDPKLSRAEAVVKAAELHPDIQARVDAEQGITRGGN